MLLSPGCVLCLELSLPQVCLQQTLICQAMSVQCRQGNGGQVSVLACLICHLLSNMLLDAGCLFARAEHGLTLALAKGEQGSQTWDRVVQEEGVAHVTL